MKTLTYDTLKEIGNKEYVLQDAPERILQFGEGNFLRGFVDYFIDVLNEKQGFQSKVVVVQPIETGLCDVINKQEGLYQLFLRGYKDGMAINQRRLISCIQRAVNPYKEFQEFLKIAYNPDLRFIVSNTTEAGIVYEEECRFDEAPPKSFPAKLTRFLYERFTCLPDLGFVILSCELIDNNGAELKRCVLRHAKQWNLGMDFVDWIEQDNTFCSTLVDRIVTGYPKLEAEEINQNNAYLDELIDTAELFGLWVIEGPEKLKEELPFEEAGLPVLFTNDHTPYKQRKVRILNGAHTSMALAAYLAGENTVRDCINNEAIKRFIQETIHQEIIPTLSFPKEELISFADAVLERFENPFIKHRLIDISLNSVSKWKARVMPTLVEYYKLFERFPKHIVFSFSALLAFYCGTEFYDGKLLGNRNGETYYINDASEVLEFFSRYSEKLSSKELIEKFVGEERFLGEDLTQYSGFVEMATHYLEEIRENGMKACFHESN
ncbi:MAG: tagaturonate reductase [Anaerovorax sp.]|nr:tagaturonate reductase [Anaerovorax sp.]